MVAGGVESVNLYKYDCDFGCSIIRRSIMQNWIVYLDILVLCSFFLNYTDNLIC